MAKRTPVTRLEQALKYWEQQMYLFNTFCRFEEISGLPQEFRTTFAGAYVHYPELRKSILAAKSMADFEFERFEIPRDKDLNPDMADMNEIFVAKVASWCLESRRVFVLEEDLQLALLSTKFGKKTLADIPWPFKTFGIQLQVPLQMTDKKLNVSACDFILASRPGRDDDLRIKGEAQDHRCYALALSPVLERWRGLSEVSVRKTERHLRERRPHPAWEKLEDEVEMPGKSEAFSLLIGHDLGCENSYVGKPDTKIEDVLEELGKNFPDNAICWRLIVGLCFYLQSSGANPAHRVYQKLPKKPKEHTLDLTAVTEGAELCTLSASFTLSRTQRDQLREYAKRGGGYELAFHFRIAHQRRPPGKGNDPNWPKTVELPDEMVNVHRRPPDSVAGGTRATIRSN